MLDVVDALARISPDSPLDRLRALRPDIRAATAGSEAAIFEAESGLTPGERHAVAAHVARLHHDAVGSSRVDLQACKLEYSIVSPK